MKTLTQRCIPPVNSKDLYISNEVVDEEVLEILFNPKWYGGGGGGGIHPLEVFPPLCQNVWHQRAETF